VIVSAVLNDQSNEINLLERLANAVAKRIKGTIPVEIDLWDVSVIAQYLKRDPSVVRERICCLPDFPKAIRLPSTRGKGHPLYKAKEVIQWAEKYQEKN
jgi:hypothetical protein